MDFKQCLNSINEAAWLSEETKSRLKEDVAHLEKTAEFGSVKNFLAKAVPPAAALIAASALSGAAGYLAGKRRHEEHTENLQKSYNSLIQHHEDVKKNITPFNQRFEELSIISPTVASNPLMAHKIIMPRLKSGFNLDDIHRLSSIEYHGAHTPRVVEPMIAAKTQALGTLSNLISTLGPAIVMGSLGPSVESITQAIKSGPSEPVPEPGLRDQIFAYEAINQGKHKDIAENVANKIKEHYPTVSDSQMSRIKAATEKSLINYGSGYDPSNPEHKKYEWFREKVSKDPQTMREIVSGLENSKFATYMEALKRGMEKKSMDMKVSEECLGRMMAERYSMYKTAMSMAPITALVRKGAKEFHEHLAMFAVPLAFAGGVSFIQKLMKERENDKLRAEADRVYAGLRKNEYVQENPEMAHQAFDALRSFAPSLAAKPMIAKTFIEHVIKSDGQFSPDQAKMLAETQKNIMDITRDTQGGFIKGLKDPLSLLSMKSFNENRW